MGHTALMDLQDGKIMVITADHMDSTDMDIRNGKWGLELIQRITCRIFLILIEFFFPYFSGHTNSPHIIRIIVHIMADTEGTEDTMDDDCWLNKRNAQSVY